MIMSLLWHTCGGQGTKGAGSLLPPPQIVGCHTQAIRLGGKCLYLLILLTGFVSQIGNNKNSIFIIRFSFTKDHSGSVYMYVMIKLLFTF